MGCGSSTEDPEVGVTSAKVGVESVEAEPLNDELLSSVISGTPQPHVSAQEAVKRGSAVDKTPSLTTYTVGSTSASSHNAEGHHRTKSSMTSFNGLGGNSLLKAVAARHPSMVLRAEGERSAQTFSVQEDQVYDVKAIEQETKKHAVKNYQHNVSEAEVRAFTENFYWQSVSSAIEHALHAQQPSSAVTLEPGLATPALAAGHRRSLTPTRNLLRDNHRKRNPKASMDLDMRGAFANI